MMQKKLAETLAHGYSSESTQRKLSNEYQHDRVLMVFRNLCVLVLWTKVASALKGLTYDAFEIFFEIKHKFNKEFQGELWFWF